MYLAFDTETGGIGQEVSLLTAYLTVLDKDFNVMSELDLALIPDDGIYRVQPAGMAVNKINLVELEKVAIPYKDAKNYLETFYLKTIRTTTRKN